MSVFAAGSFDDHEMVVFCHDRASGLKSIIAVHDTTLGPALGGCRMWDYASDDAALEDVLRLSRGMTYKAAISGLDFGGGKSVIIGNSRTGKSPAMFEALGRFIDRQGGQYIVAEDVGTTVADMDVVRRTTRHVAGISQGGGDPSPGTAWGVCAGIRAAVRYAIGRDSLSGLTVAIQGLGHVGLGLSRLLADAGAALVVADIRDDVVRAVQRELGATAVSPDAIYGQQAHVFAPCALGAVINDATVGRIKAKIVAGAANNQLAEDRHGVELARRRILYAPDYVINAGGIIQIAHEGPNYDKQAAFDQIDHIGDTLSRIFIRAAAEGVATNEMADRMARERLAKDAAQPTAKARERELAAV